MRFLLFSAVALIAGCSFSKPSMSQKVVLEVNGQKMTAQRFAQELAYRLKDQDALSAKDPRVVSQAKKKIVDEFIVQVLAEAWARDNGIILKAEDLDARINEIRRNYPDDLSFQQALADEGTSFKAWRERLQTSMLQRLVIKKVTEGLQEPTGKQMQEYYNDHKSEFAVRESAQIRQILVDTESDAKELEDQLKRGKHMADLAKKYSVSPEGPKGGVVGWIEKGLSDVFEPAFHMKQGQRSPIVKSAFGYHIFELMGRKPARTRSFNEAKDDIKRILMEKSEQSLYLSWLESQIRKARVFKDQAFIDGMQVETKYQ